MVIYSPTNEGDHPRICRTLVGSYIRIADMRAAVRQELDRIDEFKAKTGPDLKAHFGRVSRDLSIVLRWLQPMTVREARTPRQMAKWLDDGEGVLVRAIQQRKAFVAAYTRIADMRRAARLERDRIDELDAKLGAALKAHLRSVADDLDTVLRRWLAPLCLGEAQTPRQMATWLDGVEVILERTVQQRKAVEAIVEKQGSDARLIGE
jgi:hypothetical protein